jgi:periplasmic divalent cation tolerance protein
MWEGQINNDPEVRIMIKTKSWLYPHVEEFIIRNHSYSVPEIISIPIDKGSSGYLGWIDKVTE